MKASQSQMKNGGKVRAMAMSCEEVPRGIAAVGRSVSGPFIATFLSV